MLSQKSAFSGFSLIELLIVISMIGVLSAILYPALTGYFRNARDTDRIAAVESIARGMEVFFKDRARYPAPTTDGCVPDGENSTPRNLLTPTYMHTLPKSPVEDYDEGCGPSGRYAYGTDAQKNVRIITSTMEGEKNGNYSWSIVGFTGAIELSAYAASRDTALKSWKFFLSSYGGFLSESLWDGSSISPNSGWGGSPSPSNPSNLGWSRVDGVCSITSAWSCMQGDPANITHNYTHESLQCGGTTRWKCHGQHGGNNASCALQNPVCANLCILDATLDCVLPP